MRIAHPYRLELEYQQQMMVPLLLLPRPRRVLQLGLGAAALTKFCHRHCRLPNGGRRVRPDRDRGRAPWFALPEQGAA